MNKELLYKYFFLFCDVQLYSALAGLQQIHILFIYLCQTKVYMFSRLKNKFYK